MPGMNAETSQTVSELERLVELANIGAGHAASAFATLAGRTIRMDVPKVRDRRTPRTDQDEWTTGVFFEFEGGLEAVVGILFPAQSSEALVRRIVGMEEGELSEHVIESALMEVGNILASHVASAIADTLGERLLPSIPTLATNHAEAELQSLVDLRPGSHPIRVESTLMDDEGELGGLVVMVPTTYSGRR